VSISRVISQEEFHSGKRKFYCFKTGKTPRRILPTENFSVSITGESLQALLQRYPTAIYPWGP